MRDGPTPAHLASRIPHPGRIALSHNQQPISIQIGE